MLGIDAGVLPWVGRSKSELCLKCGRPLGLGILRSLITMKNYLKRFAAASVMAVFAGAASSAPVDFYLSGSGGLADSYSFLSNGVTLTVTAGSFKDGFNGDSASIQDANGDTVSGYTTSGNEYDANALVGQYSNGLGVTNNAYSCWWFGVCSTDNYHTVDGSNWDDFLTLSFSQAIQLTSASFSYFGNKDDFRLFYDISGDGVLGDDDFITYKEDDNPFVDFPVISTSLIGIVATDKNDRWKLKSVHGNILPPPPPPSVIPLPAGGLLLLTGLGAFGLMRRRKS